VSKRKICDNTYTYEDYFAFDAVQRAVIKKTITSLRAYYCIPKRIVIHVVAWCDGDIVGSQNKTLGVCMDCYGRKHNINIWEILVDCYTRNSELSKIVKHEFYHSLFSYLSNTLYTSKAKDSEIEQLNAIEEKIIYKLEEIVIKRKG